ncbi:permease [Patescibacteria group bacterium]|nr:permease [Patescibacteria group bacterium]
MDIFYPIKLLADWVTFKVLNLAGDMVVAQAVNFFIYDFIKILVLLVFIIFIVSLVRSFWPPARIRLILLNRNKLIGHTMAAILGIITPFCSCSAVPLFLGFVEAGVPLGVTFSFLVASPMINEVALILLVGLFGWKIALFYIVSGLIIAILTGLIIGKLNPESLVADFIFKPQASLVYENRSIGWSGRFLYAKEYTKDIVKKVWPYVAVGIGLGALIHGYVPMDFLASYVGADKWYAVPLAVLIGIPLYTNAAGVIPLVAVLMEKGVALGTALAFMMAVTALSLPEFMILKKVMKVKLILIFAGVIGLGIIFTGYLFNLTGLVNL